MARQAIELDYCSLFGMDAASSTAPCASTGDVSVRKLLSEKDGLKE